MTRFGAFSAIICMGPIDGWGVMRIVLAGILGAIAMFAWMSIAHMATPLGSTGLSQIPGEAPVIAAMQRSIGDHSGLYIFPWIDPKDPKMMEKYAKIMPTSPSGLLLYHPPSGATGMTKQLVYEFAKELIECLLAAFVLGLAGIAGYLSRVSFVALIGVAASISTNASYWIWYGFPADYTASSIVITFVGYLAAGLAIAAIVKPRPVQP